MAKRGRMSKTDLQYMKDNGATRSYIEIAKDLNRDPEAVRLHMEKMGFQADLKVGTFNPIFVSRLKDKPFYKSLQAQFMDDELEFFESEWDNVHEQFKDDVLPTEEMQIVDVIKIAILANRNLIQQKKSKVEMSTLEDELERELSLDESQRDLMRIENLRQQMAFYTAGLTSLAKDYQAYMDRKNKMFENLKATRKDRISRIESSRESFLSWMSELVTNPERRREIGILTEKMRLAAITEKVRLAAYHKYDNGEVDQPLLTSETVKADNKIQDRELVDG